jgi:hypothetical protein
MAASTQRPDYKGTNVTWHAFGDGTSACSRVGLWQVPLPAVIPRGRASADAQAPVSDVAGKSSSLLVCSGFPTGDNPW